MIDGEAIVCDENGLAVFDLIRRHGAGERAVLSAFDLLEFDGKDLWRRPIETRKETDMAAASSATCAVGS